MYEPVSVPEGQENFKDWIVKELDEIRRNFTVQDFINLKETKVAPKKLFVGLTMLADGINWNPGAGAGVYTYYNSTWNKLG
jgi:hypothetical protein